MKKELCRDVVGKLVKLLYKITTKGGSVFRKGRIMKVGSTYQGCYWLEALRPRHSPTGRLNACVTRVERYKFEIVKEKAHAR